MTTWHQRAAALNIETRAFINGQYTAAADKRTFPTINPATETKLADITFCGTHEIETAVAAARQSFNQGIWADLAPRERGRIMKNFAAKVREHREELALLESLDVGKPIDEALGVDADGCAYCIEWYAEAADKIGGEVAPLESGLLGLVTREPIGVVAAIVPWNFPLLMAAWKYAPALAAGNSVILKPSEKSPLSAIRLAALAHEAGIPAGVFQVLTGNGETGQALALHMDIDCVAFTGSTAVGKLIAGYAAQSNLKKVWLELGGKSPNVIFADCPDIEAAARAAAGGIFFNAGQMCTAGSRVLVQNSIRDRFLEAFKTAAAAYAPADPLSGQSRMGPLVDDIQYRKVCDFVTYGQQDAQAQLICGGNRPEGTGYYLEPTAFAVPHGHKLATEEIFGPVLAIVGFEDEADAIRIANDSEYGLGAAVWSADISRAHRVAKRLRAGTVWVNCYDEGGDMNLPFGGYKQSGNGRDKSLHALEKYTELKTTLLKIKAE